DASAWNRSLPEHFDFAATRLRSVRTVKGGARNKSNRAPAPLGSQLRRWRRQHLAIAVVLWRADDALLLHHLDQAGCAVVADLQPPLHAGNRCAPRLGDDADGLVVQLVALALRQVAVLRQPRLADDAPVAERLHVAEHAFDVLRLALAAQVRDDLVHLVVA